MNDSACANPTGRDFQQVAHPTRLVHQGFGVLWLCENFRFKSWHLADRSCRFNHKVDQKMFIKVLGKALLTNKQTAWFKQMGLVSRLFLFKIFPI